MDIGGLIGRVERILAVRSDDAAPPATLEAALAETGELAAWLASSQALLAARLATQVSYPEQRIAEATRGSVAAATKVTERAATLAAMPAVAAALDDGAVSAAHVDARHTLREATPAGPARRTARAVDALSDVAKAATVEQFQRRIRLEVRALQRRDGLDRLARQRRATRVRTWVDAEGMWRLDGRFDPVAGVKLSSRLDAELEALFAEPAPDGCPDDPVEKQNHLRARALERLLLGRGIAARGGRPEFVVVVDADAPATSSRAGCSDDGRSACGPEVDWGLPVEVPLEVLATLAGEADVHTVVVRNGVMLHAPGVTDLGRTTRLANRAQRRALRAMYGTCCVPGCRVAFDRCTIHHIVWWRNGGRTDLDNLIPICSRHHAKVHHAGWVLELGPGRQLTLRLPDGTVRSRGPTRRAAA